MKKCYNCGQKFATNEDVYNHIEKKHKDAIPKDIEVEQYYYIQRTGRMHGNCVVCKNPTKWNDATDKYHRFCDDPKCKDKYREIFKKRMVGKYGKTTLLNDPEHQKKMLANRSISGKYKWSDGKEVQYVGSYEKDFLEFLDRFMEFPSDDIIAPSPHTYYYMYGKEKKFYIPDFYIPSLNLEIEVKDGGDNPNKHPKIVGVDKVKEKQKDAVIKSQKDISFIKVTNKEYGLFMELLFAMKNDPDKKFYYGETADSGKVVKAVSESTQIESPSEEVRSAINIDTKESLMMIHDMTNVPQQIIEYADQRILYHELCESFDYNNSPTVRSRRLVERLLEYDSIDDVHDDISREVTVGDIESEEILEALLMEGRSIPYDKYVVYTETVALLENIINERAIKTKQGALYPVYVLLVHTGTFLSNVIKRVSKQPFSHASISFDLSMENMYSFGRDLEHGMFSGSFIKESIRDGIYKDKADDIEYSLYTTFVDEDQLDIMKDRLQRFIDSSDKLSYNLLGLISHAIGKESSRANKYFCSQFVDTILHSAKPYFDKHSSLVHPSDYMTNNDFYLVSSGKLSEYDPLEARANTKKVSYRIPSYKKEDKPKALFIPIGSNSKGKKVKIFSGMQIPYTYSSFVAMYPNQKYFIAPITGMKFIVNEENKLVSFIEDTILNITNTNI